MTIITIQINDNEPKNKQRQVLKRKQVQKVPWAIAMGQNICPPGDQFRFI